jgi:RNA-directed DNA polymerase
MYPYVAPHTAKNHTPNHTWDPPLALKRLFSSPGGSEEQALALRNALETRLAACKLELHPQKTKIVYCKDDNRVGNYPVQQFDFLGFTFRARRIKNRDGAMFIGFVPAVSGAAAKAMRRTVRRWRLHHRNDLTLDEVAGWVRPVVTGWINYYGRFQRSALIPVFRPLDSFLKRWARRKYQRFKSARKRTHQWPKRFDPSSSGYSRTGHLTHG